MKPREIRELSTKELIEKIDADFFLLTQKRINHSVSPANNPAELKKMRKIIAQLKTELHYRELKNMLNSDGK